MQQPPPATESGHGTASAGAPRGVGCMSGLLRLLSPYHRSQHRKRLTGGCARNTPAPPPPSSKKPPPAAPPPAPPAELRRRRSCEAPRSPTIAAEHRRRASCSAAAAGGASGDSPRPPPRAIVARLMGLEDSAPPPPQPPETAAEKRRKLLGALEKCDEDLQTLRRIIAAVRAAEMRAAAASDGGDLKAERVKRMDGSDEQQQPSPDSVLDAIPSPRSPCKKRSPPCTNLNAERKDGTGAVGSNIPDLNPPHTAPFLGENPKEGKQNGNAKHSAAHHRGATESLPRAASRWRRRPWESAAVGRSDAAATAEAWEARGGGCEWEAARIGVGLECAILRDLLQEMVAELSPRPAPQLGRCRKRLLYS